MTDLVIPQALNHARTSFKYLDSTGATRGVYTGVPQTTNYGGDRIGASIEFTQAGGGSSTEKSRRALLQSFFMALRGKTNRAYLSDSSYTRRGSFPASELFTNQDFANGVTGWSNAHNFSVADGVGRITHSGVFATSPQLYQTPSFTQFVPYCARSLLRAGAGFGGSAGPRLDTNSTLLAQTLSATKGYAVAAGVPYSATGNVAYAAISDTTGTAFDYFDVLFASASRCLLVDGGGNALLQSDAIDNAAWTKTRSSASANVHTAPDGTVTADKLTEDTTASNTHVAFQTGSRTAGAADLCAYAYVLRSAGTRNVRLAVGNDSSNYSSCIFDLGAGTANAPSNTGTATNGRAYITNVGNGWFLCQVVMTATSASTIFTQIDICSGTSNSYTGDGASALGIWRWGATISAVPTRGTQTAAAAVASATQNGTGIYVKGGRAPGEGSLSGALLAGDQVEIDNQLKILTAPLDLDASGKGYLQFSPPLRRAVADNVAVIVHRPMGRFMAASDTTGWDNVPGVFSTAAIDLEEAFG